MVINRILAILLLFQLVLLSTIIYHRHQIQAQRAENTYYNINMFDTNQKK